MEKYSIDFAVMNPHVDMLFEVLTRTTFNIWLNHDELVNIGQLKLSSPPETFSYRLDLAFDAIILNDAGQAASIKNEDVEVAWADWRDHHVTSSLLDMPHVFMMENQQRGNYYIDMMCASIMNRVYHSRNIHNFDEYSAFGARFLAAVIDYLKKGDFFEAPASTQFHDCEPGGLLKHTLNVANNVKKLSVIDHFSNVLLGDAVYAALVHDWCKIGLYESYTRNVKNEATGQWEKVPSYRRKDSALPLGHGVDSMYRASQLARITVEQALAIRWHMGEYNCAYNESSELHTANDKCPMVQMLQFADRMSCMDIQAQV